MIHCNNCPMRLFNKHYNLQGIGNPFSNKVIIIPNVDYNAYKKGDMSFSSQVDILSQILSTGELDNTYILPLIRCNEQVSCEINDDIIQNCIKYFAQDIKTYNWNNIMLCGEAARRFFNCDITDYLNTIIVSKNNRKYTINYSPFIKYIDDNKYITFKNNIFKWCNAIANNNYSAYNIIQL